MAAGRGERFGEDKLFVDVAGKPLLAWTLGNIAAAAIFASVVIVAPKPRWEAIRALAAGAGIPQPELIEGGATRQASVHAGLAGCRDADVICVHDAARPLCPPRVFAAVVAAATSAGSATAAIACVDTIKRINGRRIVETLDRSSLVAVQTPQAFLAEILFLAHNRAHDDGFTADDDCALVERGGGRVTTVDGDVRAFKVTRPEDIAVLEALLAGAVPSTG